jgi:O-antigen ligase
MGRPVGSSPSYACPHRNLTVTAIPNSARTTFIVPAGALLIAALILKFGLWTIPGLIIAVVGALGLYRIEWGIYGLIFLLPFTAVEGKVSDTLVQEFKRVLVLAIGAAWIVHLLVERRTIRLPHRLMLPILMLCSAAVLSVFRAPAPGVALSSTGRLLAYILVYVIVTADVLADEKRIWIAVRVCLISATLTAVFGLYQLIAYFKGWPTFLDPFYQSEYLLPRVHSFMAEPLWLSNYLLVTFPIALALFCWRERSWPALSLLAAGSCIVGIVISASRLGWASLLIVSPMFVLVAGSCLRRGRLLGFSAALLVGLLPVLTLWTHAFGSARDFSDYVKAFATFGGSEHGEGDLEGHIQNLGLIGDALRTSPVIGVGTNNVGFRFYADMPIAGPQISTTHNTYLDALIETGGVGLLAFVALLLVGLSMAWRGFRAFGARKEGGLCFGICMGIIGMSLHLTNWSGWREAHVWFAIGLAFAAWQAFTPPAGHSRA